MKLKIPDKYAITAIFLLATSAVLITIALLSDLGDITNAAFVISGMVCAMTGIFTLTFSGGEPIDRRLIGLLPAQGLINLCNITHHLGFYGGAYFLPPSVTGEKRVMQFNPTSTYNGKIGSAKGSFKETGPAGLVIPPSCDLLIQDIRVKNALVIPDKEEELSWLLQETIEDVFKFAHKISVRWDDNRITITFHGYLLYDGCKVIAQKFPQCCIMSPCPACSLCGALIAEGRDRVVRLDQCSINLSSRDVSAVFSILPLPDSNP
jgi:hypothetical protein